MAPPKSCTIDGCNAPHRGRGYCNAHLLRLQRHGDPLAGSTPKGATTRELKRLLAIETDECVLWPLGKLASGYGVATVDSQQVLVHQQALEHRGIPQPSPNHEATHACNVRACMNYRHLRWGTRADNERDKIGAGTSNRGARNGMAKLTSEQVAAIRAMPGSQRVIAAAFGISQQHVSSIRRGVDRRFD